MRFTTLLLLALPAFARAGDKPLERIHVTKDNRGFVTASGRPFIVWGFNYDHDADGTLIEDYWDRDWKRLAEDFTEMKDLGANVVRVHLQFAKFMKDKETPDKDALAQLGRLVKLAEERRLYLDVTGLGCYHKKDVPAWYDALGDKERWQAQAVFWKHVARVSKDSPAVFCYDLMNEPVVAGGKRKPGDWLGPPFAGSHFVQFITLDQDKRPRPQVARAWIKHLTEAIRAEDTSHMITVGLVDWSLDRPGLQSGFDPKVVGAELSFVSVHLYPKSKEIDAAIETLKQFAVGRPVLIEETFPLHCTPAEMDTFVERSSKIAAGHVGFYWGKTLAEHRRSKAIVDAIMVQWLELFERRAKALRDGK
ncbi:MAG: cellulase family glycosylhydrolase [Gemmataceae bacterium]